MMKKVLILTFVFMVLLVGCIRGERGLLTKEEGLLTRVDVQKVNFDGNYGDVVMITDVESIEIIRLAFDKVKWEPNVEPKMARKEDVKATLFFVFDKNMPERLFEYQIWFNQRKDTATIISNNPKEGYGVLDKDNAEILKSKLLEKISE
jgi:hypothetical protein